MKPLAEITTVVAIRLDGSLTVLEIDTDRSFITHCDIEIDADAVEELTPEQVGALYLQGHIAVPEECSKLFVSKSGNTIAVSAPADVIDLVERLNG